MDVSDLESSSEAGANLKVVENVAPSPAIPPAARRLIGRIDRSERGTHVYRWLGEIMLHEKGPAYISDLKSFVSASIACRRTPSEQQQRRAEIRRDLKKRQKALLRSKFHGKPWFPPLAREIEDKLGSSLNQFTKWIGERILTGDPSSIPPILLDLPSELANDGDDVITSSAQKSSTLPSNGNTAPAKQDVAMERTQAEPVPAAAAGSQDRSLEAEMQAKAIQYYSSFTMGGYAVQSQPRIDDEQALWSRMSPTISELLDGMVHTEGGDYDTRLSPSIHMGRDCESPLGSQVGDENEQYPRDGAASGLSAATGGSSLGQGAPSKLAPASEVRPQHTHRDTFYEGRGLDAASRTVREQQPSAALQISAAHVLQPAERRTAASSFRPYPGRLSTLRAQRVASGRHGVAVVESTSRDSTTCTTMAGIPVDVFASSGSADTADSSPIVATHEQDMRSVSLAPDHDQRGDPWRLGVLPGVPASADNEAHSALAGTSPDAFEQSNGTNSMYVLPAALDGGVGSGGLESGSRQRLRVRSQLYYSQHANEGASSMSDLHHEDGNTNDSEHAAKRRRCEAGAQPTSALASSAGLGT